MPTDIVSALLTLAGAVLMVSGLLIVRSAWAQRGRQPVRTLCGWCLLVVGIACATFAWGEPGLIAALAAFSVIAFVIVAMGAEYRPVRAANGRELAAEPDERPTNWTRAIAKSLLAIVLAGVAAVGIGIAFAVAAPLDAADRTIIGGLLVPMLWGAGMAWTLCDAKLVRATALLLVVSACAYGIAFLPKMLSS